ncbi:hypothetical protein JD844_011198 [Phrynosoma platyrhinos]|uniref:Tastin n=1 Tax=Phrynosoma platyrhinos TaxID=52577 RepID=A0ABQ7THM2_PHRPL|nr:hypothetical protein JD844_011198 [Phrynosoma platyrhinos]
MVLFVGVSTVEFVPDVAALASILSNTGLTSHTMSATHKPSLAGRVPLKGNRACSASAGTAQGSLYTNVPEGNLVRFSCISKSTSKADSEYSLSCDPVLNTQLLKTLSNSVKNIGPRVEAAKPRQTAQDLGVCKSEDPAAKFSPECLTRMTQAGVPLQRWIDRNEEFVPDPAAKASILSNEGLSRFALGAHGKLSLAQRVPVKSAQKPPVPCSSTRRPTPRKFYRVPLSSCRKDRRLSTKHPMEKEGKIAVRLFDDEVAASVKKVPTVPVITPEMRRLQCIELLAQFLQQEMNNGAVDRDVAPSLEELHKLLSAHCSPAQPVHLSTPSQDPRPNFCKATPLSTVVAPETSTALITPSQDSSPIFCKAKSLSTVVGPETGKTLTTTSSQPPVCPSTSVRLAQPPSSSANSSGKVKQRLDDLLRAPQRFHEACLNDECAFYTARIMSASQPSVQRCKDPVAKTLDAHDAMYFIPISAPLSPVDEEEKPASS